jgi:glycosyltransferase involved in cell wall biosynthesis
MPSTLRILGIRGIPAAHGGFETFAQSLALHLVANGWRVVVYCQEEGSGPLVEDRWQGVERVRIPVATAGTAGTMVFDWRAIAHAARHRDLCLTLGYNTALFNLRLCWARVPGLMNMDGIEWHRAKWGRAAKAWFWLNERVGMRAADHLVADHPEIARHLARRGGAERITTIPYGAERLQREPAFDLARFGLTSSGYLTLIARPEPENSIVEIISAFSARPRGVKLAVLGSYEAGHAYHERVRAAAGPEVLFLGAIYDKPVVQQLRAHALAYLHGHQVGGTNPSLVEALGAHNPVFAHDNPFNRWVAGAGAVYFDSAPALDAALSAFLADPAQQQRMREASALRHEAEFTDDAVLERYRRLLERWARQPG